MNIGTHIPDSKKQLSDKEREMLGYLLDNFDKPLTTREIIPMYSKDFDISFILSNLVGMDLCVEKPIENPPKNVYTKKEDISKECTYQTPRDTPQYFRAMYAYYRTEGTLWHILHGKMQYGQKLWPFRPIDRVKLVGKVRLINGLYTLMFDPNKELKDLLEKEVNIRVDLKV